MDSTICYLETTAIDTTKSDLHTTTYPKGVIYTGHFVKTTESFTLKNTIIYSINNYFRNKDSTTL